MKAHSLVTQERLPATREPLPAGPARVLRASKGAGRGQALSPMLGGRHPVRDGSFPAGLEHQHDQQLHVPGDAPREVLLERLPDGRRMQQATLLELARLQRAKEKLRVGETPADALEHPDLLLRVRQERPEVCRKRPRWRQRRGQKGAATASGGHQLAGLEALKSDVSM